ncbi:cytochrome P450 [Streptomyces rubradiris]|nr:cytochrome P450 [Streptomyces rubradiris]
MDDLTVYTPSPPAGQNALVVFPQARECPELPPSGYAPLRGSAPLGRVMLRDGRSAWAVTGHALARELLSDPRLSRDRSHPGFLAPEEWSAEVGTHGASPALVADPGDEAPHRPPLPYLTPRRTAALRPHLQRIADRLLTGMERQGPPADLVSAFALPMSALAIGTLLGVPYEDHDFFEGCSGRLLRGRTVREAATARAELERYTGQLLDRKRHEPGDGLLDDLMRQDGQGSLDRARLVTLPGTLLARGHETTADLVALAAFTLLRHPEHLAVLRAGKTPMTAVAEELLRCLATPNGILRVAVEDVEIAGRTIRSGECVVFVTALINRDATVFAEPETLDWDRPAGHHLAFGSGVHECLGRNLVRAQLEIALGSLFTRFPGLRLAVPAEEIRSKPANPTSDGLLELPVAW